MYRRKSKGWYKHKDFILLDLFCMFLAFLIAYIIRNGGLSNFIGNRLYLNALGFVILADIFSIIFFEFYHGVLRRGLYVEFKSAVKQTICVELASGLFLFSIDNGHEFSRIVLYLTGIIYLILTLLIRVFWKKHIRAKMAEGGEHSLYIVTSSDIAAKVIQNIRKHNYNRYNIN